MLGNDATHDRVDLTGHVGSITADVKVSLLLKQSVDLCCVLLEPVLDVNLLITFTRECSNELEVVAKILLVLLRRLVS